MDIVIAITSVYLLIGALLVRTDNIMSAMLFKIVPFFLGVGLGIIALRQYGVV
jgi:hypothetical protein